ncbi:electron transport complex subunit RsxC [Motiliproteus sp. MSK22-1]|uniref:electron transport complex subunit RsxC n=1 Tax=Motiliproteus sp. MSK22-1 TaxID=1897630 RepID=UPI0009776554|nr:electron transport complex subunit RsxC [Motiliproteus sp. MSK22-1]OMH37953.1 electron transporter RnfC [Motiliproteus sp. MSK22-1]
MKLFGFRGGVHPEALKHHTEAHPIRKLPMPRRLYIPLQQHIGAPAKAEVEAGDRVDKGQLLARSQGLISAPVHAPTSGTIVAIEERPAPHPTGLPVKTIVIETDGQDRSFLNATAAGDPFNLSPEEIANRVGQAGIVGMGGATFPSAVKLMPNPNSPIHTLIINGSECEPYLTCDDRLMQERPNEVIDGIRLIRHALKANCAILAIEDNKPAAYAAMMHAAEETGGVQVIQIPSRYPMGWEKQLVQIVTGHEIPHGQLPGGVGVCVHNVGTAFAIHRTLRADHPLLSRIVTVSGGAIKRPQNLEVPIGALISDLIEFCGGLTEPPARLVMGGPMMGQVMPHQQVPIVKGSSGILALSHHEIDDGPERPCIRCGRCVMACPVGLMPLEMGAKMRSDDVTGAEALGVQDCISCGCCSYVCPSKIPLVQYFNYAKGELQSRRAAKSKTDQTREWAQARIERLEREALEKAELKAQRAAAKAEKEARSAERKAAEKSQ